MIAPLVFRLSSLRMCLIPEAFWSTQKDLAPLLRWRSELGSRTAIASPLTTSSFFFAF